MTMTPLERQLDRLERGILLRNGITPENPPEQIRVLLAAIGKWDEALHPRGRDGRFIEKFGFLSGTFNWMSDAGDSTNPVGGGKSKKVSRAKVVGFSSGNGASADDPWVKVEYEGPDPELQGQVGFARASEVSQAAGTKARLDAPEGQSNDADREAQMEALRARVHEIDQRIAEIDSGQAKRDAMATVDDPTIGQEALDDRLNSLEEGLNLGDETSGVGFSREKAMEILGDYSEISQGSDGTDEFVGNQIETPQGPGTIEDTFLAGMGEKVHLVALEDGSYTVTNESADGEITTNRYMQQDLDARDADLDEIDPDDPRFDLNVPDDSGVRTPSGMTPANNNDFDNINIRITNDRGETFEAGTSPEGLTFVGDYDETQDLTDARITAVDTAQGLVTVEYGDGNSAKFDANNLTLAEGDQLAFEEPEPAPAPDPDLPAGESFEPDPKGDADQVRAFIADSIEKKGLDPEDASMRSRQLDEMYGAIGFGSALDTDQLYKENGVWTEERQALHEEMWTELIGQIEAAGIPKERDALALGGLPGAGKSFTLKPGEAASEFGVVSWEPEPGNPPPAGATHVSINPDIIKEILIQKGALPPGIHPDLKPMEQVNFIHEESSELSKLFVQMLSDEGYNIVLDNTMEKPDGMIKRMKPLAEAGYKFRGLFVDIPVSESRESARKRYERGMATELGGRFVPSGVQRDEPSKNGRLSPNRDAFDELAGIDADGNPGGPSWFTDFMVVDNTGVAGDPPKPKKEVVLRSTGDGSLATVHNPVDTMASETGEVTDTGEIIPEGDFRNQEDAR